MCECRSPTAYLQAGPADMRAQYRLNMADHVVMQNVATYLSYRIAHAWARRIAGGMSA